MKNDWKIFTFFILLTTSCGGNTNSEVPEPKVLSPEHFAEVIKSQDILLIDVRTASEYEEGFIAGAVNIDVKQADFENKIKHLDRNMPIAVYCARGGRSAQAAEIFKKLGFQEVYDLKGGYTLWTEQAK